MDNNILKNYLESRLSKKEAAIRPLGILGKLGGSATVLGSKAGLAALVGLPALIGVVGGILASRITSPASTDLKDFEKGKYLDSLNARIERLQKCPKAGYIQESQDRSLRI